jgi:hypothetical protein
MGEITKDRKTRIFAAAAIFVLAAIPILVTPFPPATDLPQHLAQVRLLEEALRNPGGPYAVNWAAPGNLIYAVIYAFRAILPEGWTARAVILLCAGLWIAAIHGLAARRGRSATAAVVASLLVFNQSLYWGFVNFLLGFPVFVLWFALTTRDPDRIPPKRFGLLVLTSFLLYGSHALWFAAGAAWLLAITVLKKPSAKTFLLRMAVLIPCGAVALLWYPHLAAARAMAGYDVSPHWIPFSERLGSLLNAAFGGIRGPAETIAFVFVYAWLALTVWQNRARLKNLADRDMLAVPAFLSIVLLFAPHMYMNTIFFASRWFPTAMVFLLLALPAPAINPRLLRVISFGVLIAFFAATFVAWQKYRTTDLAGFREALDRIPEKSRVMGLDVIKESDILKGRPFLQLTAYAQVFKGSELNFSFAGHYSGLVSFRTARKDPWTSGLDWHPERLQLSDFGYFDYVFINGREKDHEAASGFSELEPVTTSGRWRLYRVVK